MRIAWNIIASSPDYEIIYYNGWVGKKSCAWRGVVQKRNPV